MVSSHCPYSQLQLRIVQDARLKYFPSVRHSAHIRVSDSANPAAHLAVRTFVLGGNSTINAGSNVSFAITVTNLGPDAAENVVLSNPTPVGTNLVGFQQTFGDAFSCMGDSDCSIGTLPAGGLAEFEATFQVDAQLAGGTLLQNSVSVTSATADPNDTESSAVARFQVFNPGGILDSQECEGLAPCLIVSG